MSVIAIITARGGSKRIPQKNIKEFMGKPMIAYAIQAAKDAGFFDEIMVSTDNNEIAEIAIKYGAVVPFMRSKATSDDFATTFDVIDEVIANYKRLGKFYDEFCCIYPCVPFLRAETLKKAYNIFKGHDALQPVCQYPVPIEWAMEICDNGTLVPVSREAQKLRSQDIKPKYFDAGMFYFCKTLSIYQHNSLTPNDMVAYVMDEQECQDIDTPTDWNAAEIKYKVLHNV